MSCSSFMKPVSGGLTALTLLALTACAESGRSSDSGFARETDPMARAFELISADLDRAESDSVVDVSHQDLLDKPDQWKDAWVRIPGTSCKSWPASVIPGEDNSDAWHSLLMHAGPAFTYVVSASEPRGWDRMREDPVAVTGRFVGIHAYKARNGETIQAPLVVADKWEWLDQ